jgi:hypothetical protein
LPINCSNGHTPDEKIKVLRNEERRCAEAGNYIEAQKIKEEI